MKQAIKMLLILLLAVAAANIGHTAETLSQLEHSVIRLHILADSDETSAQLQKLLVRDALLQNAEQWIPSDTDFLGGCEAIQKRLPEIRQTALNVLREAGCQDSVSVCLEETAFPERKYGDLTLPAGTYQALRVEIGKAEGQNWWCVMYPAMCISAAAQDTELHFDDSAYDMARNPERYEVRLKFVETARAVKKWFRNVIKQTEAAPPDGETAIPQKHGSDSTSESAATTGVAAAAIVVSTAVAADTAAAVEEQNQNDNPHNSVAIVTAHNQHSLS